MAPIKDKTLIAKEDKLFTGHQPMTSLYPLIDTCLSPPDYESDDESTEWMFQCIDEKRKRLCRPKLFLQSFSRSLQM